MSAMDDEDAVEVAEPERRRPKRSQSHWTAIGLAIAAFGAALFASAPAQADEKIPNPNCMPNSACIQSYLQGQQWSFTRWRPIVGRRTIDIFGTPSHPEPAVAFCRGVLAAANNSGNAPADPYHFLGGCHDFVLDRWYADYQLSMPEVLEREMHW